MDVRFFATLLASRYSKGEEEFDTSIFIVGENLCRITSP
jgi:hypothetical protein